MRPIYRDKTNLEVTDEHYWKNIRIALEESRYLIVLASPHSAKSTPVDMEVAHFLASHDQQSKLVVPIILSGRVNGVDDDAALCPTLRELGATITSRNLPKMLPDASDIAERDAWEQAFVDLISYLLRLDKKAVGDHIQREERKQALTLRKWFISVTVLAVLAVLSAAWAIKRERESLVAKNLAEERRQIAEIEKNNARESEGRAVRARSTAEKLINSMMFTLADELRPLGRLDLLDHVSKEAEHYFSSNPSNDVNSMQNEGALWNNRGEVLLKSGNLKDARKAFEKSLEIDKRLKNIDPSGVRRSQNILVSYFNLGTVAEYEEDLEAARNFFNKALITGNQFLIRHPQDAEVQIYLALCYTAICDIEILEGNLSEAEKAIKKTQMMHKGVSSRINDSNRALYDLISSQSHAVERAISGGNLSAAGSISEKRLATIKHRASKEKYNASLQLSLANAYREVGDVFDLQEEYDKAMESYDEAKNIYELLAKTDSLNIYSQREYGIIHNRLGSISRVKGDLDSARKAFEHGLKISNNLAQLDSNNSNLQRDLFISYHLLGDIFQRQGDFVTARKLLNKALEGIKGLADRAPRDTQSQRELSVIYYRLGLLTKESKDLSDARDFFEKALAIRRRLASANPESAIAQLDLFSSQSGLFDFYANQNDRENTLKYLNATYQTVKHIEAAGFEVDSTDKQLFDYIKKFYDASSLKD